MSEIYFVRHGQASLGARNYDQLSPLGWEQARWLGEYFRDRGLEFDRVVIGDMRRHRETLEGISAGMGLRNPSLLIEASKRIPFHCLDRN